MAKNRVIAFIDGWWNGRHVRKPGWTLHGADGKTTEFKARPWRMFWKKITWQACVLLALSVSAQAETRYAAPVGKQTVDITSLSLIKSSTTANAGDTILFIPSPGKRLIIKHIYFTNLDAFVTSVCKFRFGTGNYFWRKTLNVLAGESLNLAGANVVGGIDEEFRVNLSPALVVGLSVTIVYDEI
jgi:hypothetical protein